MLSDVPRNGSRYSIGSSQRAVSVVSARSKSPAASAASSSSALTPTSSTATPVAVLHILNRLSATARVCSPSTKRKRSVGRPAP